MHPEELFYITYIVIWISWIQSLFSDDRMLN